MSVLLCYVAEEEEEEEGEEEAIMHKPALSGGGGDDDDGSPRHVSTPTADNGEPLPRSHHKLHASSELSSNFDRESDEESSSEH